MAGKTYKTRGIVLRKTKLGEKDLIVSILDESGSLLRAVAKGARKPGGSYAARVELFSIVDLMLAQGRNLDVITGAVHSGESSTAAMGIEQSSCASVLAELLSSLAQEGLPHEKLFDMSCAAFSTIAREEPLGALAVTGSALLKSLAYAGFRPSFTTCVSCGTPMPASTTGPVAFSVVEGGMTCAACSQPSDVVKVDAETLRWAEALMRSRFDAVLGFNLAADPLFAVMQLVRQWTRVHVGKNLKSLDFLMTCGMF